MIEGTNETLSRAKAALLVAALTLGALALRATGLSFLLPHEVEPDAVVVWQAAWLDKPADAAADERAYLAPFYPFLLAYTLHALPGSGYTQPAAADAPLAEHLAAASLPYLRARALIACLSVLAIPATYRVARRFFSRHLSIVAAAFVATSLLFQAYSQQARPHAASTALSVVAVASSLAVLRRPTLVNQLVAAGAGFLALGCFHNGVFALPPLVLGTWLAGGRRWRGLALLAAGAAGAVVEFYPFLFEPHVVAPGEGDLSIGGQVLAWSSITPMGFVHLARGLASYDPVLVLLASIGLAVIVVALERRERSLDRRALVVAASFPVGFLCFWGFMLHVFPRFTIPLVPYAALLATAATSAILPRVTRALGTRARTLATVAGIVAAFAIPVLACVRLARLRAADDPQTLAARWLVSHADRERDVVAVGMHATVPLFARREDVLALPHWWRGAWERYRLALPLDARVDEWSLVPILREGVNRDALLSIDEVALVLDESRATFGVVVPPTMGAADRDATRDVFRLRGGEPRASWHPYDLADHELSGSGYELGFYGFERVVRSRLWGQPIEIYGFGER